jgi:hypothetical protein
MIQVPKKKKKNLDGLDQIPYIKKNVTSKCYLTAQIEPVQDK